MSCGDLLEKFDDLVKRFKAEFKEIIENERAKMKAEVEAYNAEKEQIQAINVSDDDIIHLNIGGQKFSTTRSTLCQVEGSLLATMFSGRWEDNLKRDENGAIFFDFNPKHFGLIMEYLRVKKITNPENMPTLPKVAEDELNNFNTLVEYLGLSDEITFTGAEGAEVNLPSEKFEMHGPEISLQEDEAVAIHSQNWRHEYACGQNIYQEGIVHFKLKLESFENNGWMFVGAVNGDLPQQERNHSYAWPNTYGWALGNSGHVLREGLQTIDDALKNLSRQGDIIELVLDITGGKLSLHLPTGEQFNMDIPKFKTWRLHVNISRKRDKIRIC